MTDDKEKHCTRCTMSFTERQAGEHREVTKCPDCALPMTQGQKFTGKRWISAMRYTRVEEWEAADWIKEGPWVPFLKRTG